MGHLRDKDVKRITKLIDNWSEPKLTWPLLVDECREKLGISRTRQALSNIPAIDMAMKDRKAALKAPRDKPEWLNDVYEANERIQKLTETNQKLKAINQQLIERFLTWQANADMHGLTQSMLDQPVSQLWKKR